MTRRPSKPTAPTTAIAPITRTHLGLGLAALCVWVTAALGPGHARADDDLALLAPVAAALAKAGLVRDKRGQSWVVVAMINHEQAGRGWPVLDALVRWVAEGGGAAPGPAPRRAPRTAPAPATPR